MSTAANAVESHRKILFQSCLSQNIGYLAQRQYDMVKLSVILEEATGLIKV